MKRQPSLQFCMLMDAIGCIPFIAVPLLGEAFDVIWAPISAIIFYFSFGGRKATFGAAFSLAEGNDSVCQFHSYVYNCLAMAAVHARSQPQL